MVKGVPKTKVPDRGSKSARRIAMERGDDLERLEEEGLIVYKGYFRYAISEGKPRGSYYYKLQTRADGVWHEIPSRAVEWFILGARAREAASIPDDEL